MMYHKFKIPWQIESNFYANKNPEKSGFFIALCLGGRTSEIHRYNRSTTFNIFYWSKCCLKF